MRLVLVSVAAILIAAPAFAGGSRSSSNSTSVSQSQAISKSQANNAGNNQNTTFQDRRQAPGIGLAGLAAAGNVCLGSVSVGGSGPGFGLGFGTTTKDEPCNLREYAKLLAGLGYKREAVTVLMNDPVVRGAFEANNPTPRPVAVPGRTSTVAPFDLGSGRN